MGGADSRKASRGQADASKGTPVVLLTSDEAPIALPANAAVTPTPTAISAVPDNAPVTVPVASTDVPRHTRFQWRPRSPDRHDLSGGERRIAAAVAVGIGSSAAALDDRRPRSPLVAPEPHVRSSYRIPSPVTIGSGIVLPASYTEWDMKKLKTVLAHERSHVRQFDFYLQLLAGLYTALFWFSPLGWWLRRTLISLGEAIGDRAGIDAAASRSGYAEILLEFAAMPRQTLQESLWLVRAILHIASNGC